MGCWALGPNNWLRGFLSPAEVPDFFLLQNMAPAGKDRNGNSIFKAERTNVTIQDVIAATGPREPDASHSQRNFNTDIVLVVEHGHTPSKALTERANGIRKQWIYYWGVATGRRSKMTVSPR